MEMLLIYKRITEYIRLQLKGRKQSFKTKNNHKEKNNDKKINKFYHFIQLLMAPKKMCEYSH